MNLTYPIDSILRRWSLLLIAVLLLQSFCTKKLTAQDPYQSRLQRSEWFRKDRFGMFIHWGLYAIPSRGEWVSSHEEMTQEAYHAYFESFNPTEYHPAEWARLARQAGMKYAVITTKHHDGFCLFDSQFTEYKATNTPAGRDLIKEFLEAFRKEGLKVGFYYSLLDWHHPDYPAYGDRQHPMRNNTEYRDKETDFDNYVSYMQDQVRELCSNYGKIDIMWFDFSYWDMTGEKWKASELVKMVRQLQPGLIIDNRLGGHIEWKEPELFAGDFEGPEQVIPTHGVFDDLGRPLPWELCLTLNNHWGYSSTDTDYKSAGEVISTLVNCVSKGGNLLLNVGPDALGRIPDESSQVLREVGTWMDKNSSSIYGCGDSGFPKPEWGYYTRKDERLYLHLLRQPVGQICLPGLKGKVEWARLLRDGSEMILSEFWNGERYYIPEDDLFINFSKPQAMTYTLPDPINTVIELKLK